MTKSFRFTNHSTIQSLEVISPQEMTKTDITSPQFAHAIYEASEHLPDVPYDFAQYEPVNAVETPDEYPQSPNPRLLQPEFLHVLIYLLYFIFSFIFQELLSNILLVVNSSNENGVFILNIKHGFIV